MKNPHVAKKGESLAQNKIYGGQILYIIFTQKPLGNTAVRPSLFSLSVGFVGFSVVAPCGSVGCSSVAPPPARELNLKSQRSFDFGNKKDYLTLRLKI